MFDTVRNNSKIMMGLLFLLVIPSFVMFGLEGYSRFTDKAAAVAHVDGNKITQQEWDDAHKREVDRIRAQMPNVDIKLLDSPSLKLSVLERLVEEQLIRAAVTKYYLLNDDRINGAFLKNKDLRTLIGADGRLDSARFSQFAASQNMTPEGFRHYLISAIARSQLLGVIEASSLLLTKQTDAALQAYLQRREVQIQKFAAKDYAGKVQASEADLESFYKAQAERFRSIETADVEYLVLDISSLMSTISLPEQDVKTYYEQNLQRLAGQEQRRASHILINAAKDAPTAERYKAKAKAQELLRQIRKSPKSFAEVARKNSQDDLSASKGGDLGFSTRDGLVSSLIADVVYSLEEGDISDVVESEFGFHIIQLTGIKSPKAPSFEAMRPQLEADLRKQQAQRKFAELADTFSNSVYEQADALQPVADKLKLTLRQAKGVTRVPGGSVPAELSNPKVLQALFSEDAVSKRRNTEAIETGANALVSARIVKHYPAVVRPLDEVKDDVRRQFVQFRALEMARAEGQDKLATWQKQASQASLDKPLVISRDQPQGQPQAVVEAALRADPAKLPVFAGVDLGAEGYAVVRVNKLVPRDPQPEEQARQTRQQFAQLWSQAEVQAYLAALKKQFKVEILPTARKAEASGEKR